MGRFLVSLLGVLLMASPAWADWTEGTAVDNYKVTEATPWTYDFTDLTQSDHADFSSCGYLSIKFDQSVSDGSTDAEVELRACRNDGDDWPSCVLLRSGPSQLPDATTVGLGGMPKDRPYLIVKPLVSPVSDTARITATCSLETTTTAGGSGTPDDDSVDVDKMADDDFGDWTCASGDCTLDAGVVAASELAATLTMSDGDFVDFSAVDQSSATEGIKVPAQSNCANATGAGALCVDSDTGALNAGDGSAVHEHALVEDLITGADVEDQVYTATDGDWPDPDPTTIAGGLTKLAQEKVTGPASVTADGNLVRFDGTTGKLVKDGGAWSNSHNDLDDRDRCDNHSKYPCITSDANSGVDPRTTSPACVKVGDLFEYTTPDPPLWYRCVAAGTAGTPGDASVAIWGLMDEGLLFTAYSTSVSSDSNVCMQIRYLSSAASDPLNVPIVCSNDAANFQILSPTKITRVEFWLGTDVGAAGAGARMYVETDAGAALGNVNVYSCDEVGTGCDLVSQGDSYTYYPNESVSPEDQLAVRLRDESGTRCTQVTTPAVQCDAALFDDDVFVQVWGVPEPAVLQP